MGYSKNTSKTATALDYAQIDHYKQSTVAGLMGQTIDPLDMSVENISQYANRNLDKGVSSKGYNFHSSNKGTNYALELGLPSRLLPRKCSPGRRPCMNRVRLQRFEHVHGR